MTITLYRIATEAPAYGADDLSGAGAEKTGGRWNAQETSLVYTSCTRALACLETLAHLNAGGLPLNRFLVAVTVPNDTWARARRETATSVPVGWDAEPAGRASIGFGTAWKTSSASALLVVPSVIVQEEFNVLINPAHSDAAGIKAKTIRKWLYDPRLRSDRSSGVRRKMF